MSESASDRYTEMMQQGYDAGVFVKPPISKAGGAFAAGDLSLVALGAVRAGINLGHVHIFDYYRRALRTIVDEGLLSFLRRTSTPYLTRAGSHFDPRSVTYSERFLRRWADWHSPMGHQTTPQTQASDEENAARG
jgi:hypothetical protein